MDDYIPENFIESILEKIKKSNSGENVPGLTVINSDLGKTDSTAGTSSFFTFGLIAAILFVVIKKFKN